MEVGRCERTARHERAQVHENKADVCAVCCMLYDKRSLRVEVERGLVRGSHPLEHARVKGRSRQLRNLRRASGRHQHAWTNHSTGHDKVTDDRRQASLLLCAPRCVAMQARKCRSPRSNHCCSSWDGVVHLTARWLRMYRGKWQRIGQTQVNSGAAE
jgi:hypothetical protein